MNTLTIHAELLAAARTHDAKFADKHAKEDVQTYLKRILTTVADVADPVFEGLSPEASAWYEAGCAAMTAKTAIDACPGFADAEPTGDAPKKAGRAKPGAAAPEPAPAAAEREYLDADGNPLKGLALVNAKRKAAKEAGGTAPADAGTKPAAATKIAKAKKEKEPKGQTTTGIIRDAILDSPGGSVDDVRKLLASRGHTINASTVNTTYTQATQLIAQAKAKGLWK